MDCEKAKTLIHEYLDNGREPNRELKEHLDGCADCAELFTDLKAQGELLRAMSPAEWTPDADAFKRAVKKARTVRICRITGWCAAAAAVLTVGVVSVLFMAPHGADSAAREEAAIAADMSEEVNTLSMADETVFDESARAEAGAACEPEAEAAPAEEAVSEESVAEEPELDFKVNGFDQGAGTEAGSSLAYSGKLGVSAETGERLYAAFADETGLFLTMMIDGVGFSVYIDNSNISKAQGIFAAEGLDPKLSEGSEVLITY